MTTQPPARIRLLIVDDHPIVRDGLVSILHEGEPDLEVVGEAGDGKEGVAAWRRLRRPCGSLLGTCWVSMVTGWCFSQRQLQGGLSAICRWTVLLVFYCYCITITIAPQGDALQRGTWGVSTCCIAVCLFMGM